MDHVFSGTYRFTTDPTVSAVPKRERCPLCHGTGWLEHDNGTLSPDYVACPCLKRRRRERSIARFMDESGLAAMADRTFESFKLTGRNTPDSPDIAYQIAVDYAAGGADAPWFLLYGTYGVGKTHLALAIANYWITERLKPAVFGVVPDLIDKLRAGYRDGSYDELLTTLQTVDLLVLDDFGIGKSGAETNEYRLLFQILNSRSMRRSHTVITTNLNPQGIEPRMRSRLMDKALCQRVEIIANDTRVY